MKNTSGRFLTIGIILFILMMNMQLMAQSLAVSGVVTSSDDQLPIPGVSVIVKGTTTGTITNMEGEFKLSAETGEILQFSFVGMKPKEVTISNQETMRISLEPETIGVDEVVVTALGIKREEKSLGYGLTKVDEEEIQSTAGTDVMSSLQGKVAGLDLGTSQGGLGTSSRVVLRGNSSITGGNQPLYVVDGVPVISEAVESGEGVWDRKNFGSGAMDINPDDIAGISVLKGPNAAALYGSRAQNGAILITTKSGTKGTNLGVEFSSANMFDVITDQFLPEFQNEYGQGQYVDGKATYSEIIDTSWGSKMDGQSLPSWSPLEENTPYAAQPNNIRDFFRTGFKSTNTLALNKGFEGGSARFSYSNLSGKGTLPGNDQTRHNFSLRTSMELASWLRFDGKANYINQEINGGTWLGESGGNAIYGLFLLPRNVRLDQLKTVEHNGMPHDPFTGTQMNPYWTTTHDEMINNKDRFIGFAKLDFDITKKLSGFVRAGTDYTNMSVEERYNRGHSQFGTGRWERNQYLQRESNFDMLLSYKEKIGDLDLGVNAGGNIRKEFNESTFNRGSTELLTGFWNVQNYKEKNSSYNYSEKQVNSAYATVNLGYKRFLYADLSARNDVSSTLNSENRSYFYPAVSATLLLNEIVEMNNVNLFKVRAGYAEVGNDTDAYRLHTTFAINQNMSYQDLPLMDVSGLPGVYDLKPERTGSYELGLDIRAFNSRLNFDANYYLQSTKDQLLTTPVSPTTGFTDRYVNAGEVVNRGFELSLGGIPIQTNNLTWETTITLARNRTEVVELYQGMETQVLAQLSNICGGATIVAKTGKDGYGVIQGTPSKIDGNYVFDQQRFANIEEQVELGNFNPDATFGFLNSFNYKRLNVRVMIDGKIGGDVLNATSGTLTGAGVTKNTLQYRETGVTLQGVALGTNEVVETTMTAQDYWNGMSNYGEPWVVDATNVRIREISMGYSFPLSQDWFLKSLRLNLNAYNLGFIYRSEGARDIDPNQTWGSGNAQGYNFLNTPTATSYGFSVNMKF